MSIRIRDGLGSNLLTVTANGEARVFLTEVPDYAGFVCGAVQRDDGEFAGGRLVRALDASEKRRLRVGLDTPLFAEWLGSGALNTSLWTTPVSTMTAALAGGFMNLNNGLSVASGAYAQAISRRGFPFVGSYPLLVDLQIQFAQLPVTNNICEWGLMQASGVSAPTDGVFFRLNATGEFRCVVNFNGTENQSASMDFLGLVGTLTTRRFRIELSDQNALFWIDGVLVAVVARPNNAPSLVASNNLPVHCRTYNNAAVGLAQQLKLAMACVSLGDMEQTKPWPHIQTGAGMHSFQGYTGAGTIGQLALLANNANPTAAAPTNTTAALGSGLGGVFLANVSGLAVTTDYIISSYQVPAGTALVPGRMLMLTGVKFNAVNMGAANAAAPLTWLIGLATGHTAVSLATTESATAKAPRRLPLGVQSLVASAAIGVPAAPEIVMPFASPVPVFPGEFVATFLRFLNFTSTASQALWCYVTFEGYWE